MSLDSDLKFKYKIGPNQGYKQGLNSTNFHVWWKWLEIEKCFHMYIAAAWLQHLLTSCSALVLAFVIEKNSEGKMLFPDVKDTSEMARAIHSFLVAKYSKSCSQSYSVWLIFQTRVATDVFARFLKGH
jgi:hypothetical protein